MAVIQDTKGVCARGYELRIRAAVVSLHTCYMPQVEKVLRGEISNGLRSFSNSMDEFGWQCRPIWV